MKYSPLEELADLSAQTLNQKLSHFLGSCGKRVIATRPNWDTGISPHCPINNSNGLLVLVV